MSWMDPPSQTPVRSACSCPAGCGSPLYHQAPTLSAKTARGAAFNSVVRHLTGNVFYIDVVINVGIHPFDFRDDARELDRFLAVVLCSKRMVCQQGSRGAENTKACSQDRECI